MLKYRPNDPKVKTRDMKAEEITNRKAKPADKGKGSKAKVHQQNKGKR